MNILFTSIGNIDDAEHRATVREWRERHHIVETMPAERLISYIRLDPASPHAQIDVIVCNADLNAEFFLLFDTLEKAVRIANEVADLPEYTAMRDGRKWRMIPFIIIGSSPHYFYQPAKDLKGRHGCMIGPNPYTDGLLRQIQEKVDTYLDRLLQEYNNCGMMVRVVNGRSQISPALKRKKRYEESEYYHVSGDRRNLAKDRWLTVARDNEGLRADIAMLEQLLDMNATEQEMQRFFEEHPAILMQARLGIPIAHPTYAIPRKYSPDFAITPVLGGRDGDLVNLLEIKGPDAPLFNSLRHHKGFSMALHRAIDQVRDYGRYLSDPQNAVRLIKKLGYLPTTSKLAVLIGRERKDDIENEIFRRREEELINVEVITYQEILQGQANQLRSLVLPGNDTLPRLQ